MFNYKGAKLKDKVAIITGASRGVGKTTALVFAEVGAKVTVASRNMESQESLILQNPEKKKNLFPIRVDITQREQIQNMVDQTIEGYGRIDILDNNAGIFASVNPEDITK